MDSTFNMKEREKITDWKGFTSAVEFYLSLIMKKSYVSEEEKSFMTSFGSELKKIERPEDLGNFVNGLTHSKRSGEKPLLSIGLYIDERLERLFNYEPDPIYKVFPEFKIYWNPTKNTLESEIVLHSPTG